MSKLTPHVNENDHVKGSPSASIELVEYGDFQCPYCGAAYPVVNAIIKNFGKKLRFVFRNFPLQDAHPYAQAAAIAAESADRQGKFWEMHDMIYENQRRLNVDTLYGFAKTLGLDMAKFEEDMADEAIGRKVESDFESGIRSGVNGTPSFFINGNKYNGSYDLESISEALKAIDGVGHTR